MLETAHQLNAMIRESRGLPPLSFDAYINGLPELPDTPPPSTGAGRAARTTLTFVLGMAGAGKVTTPLRMAGRVAGRMAGRVGRMARGALDGALTDFVVTDPDEANFAALLREQTGLRDPITDWLAGDPDDPVLERRLKNALAGAALGVPVDGMLGALGRLRANRATRESRRLTLGQAGPREVEQATLDLGPVRRTRVADEVNLVENPDLTNPPPYLPGTEVLETVTAQDSGFVRVFLEGSDSMPAGKWLMRREDVLDANRRLLSPRELSLRFGIAEPDMILPVRVRSGTRLRVGITNLREPGGGGFLQFELVSKVNEESFITSMMTEIIEGASLPF